MTCPLCLTSESLVDVTLSCEGRSLKAHKLVLSACSPYFKALFQEHVDNHPIVILKGRSSGHRAGHWSCNVRSCSCVCVVELCVVVVVVVVIVIVVVLFWPSLSMEEFTRTEPRLSIVRLCGSSVTVSHGHVA